MGRSKYGATQAERLRNCTDMSPAHHGCWLWTGPTSPQGRPQLHWRGRTRPVSRVVWETSNGPIPSDQSVLHRCDNLLCVNPDHLFLGNHEDNMSDMAAKNRASRHGTSIVAAFSKMNADRVRLLRQRHAEGESLHGLARDFDISRSHAQGIVHRRKWAHVA